MDIPLSCPFPGREACCSPELCAVASQREPDSSQVLNTAYPQYRSLCIGQCLCLQALLKNLHSSLILKGSSLEVCPSQACSLSQEKFTFCNAPVNVREPRQTACLLHFATRYANKLPVNLEVVATDKVPATADELQHMESLHQVQLKQGPKTRKGYFKVVA